MFPVMLVKIYYRMEDVMKEFGAPTMADVMKAVAA